MLYPSLSQVFVDLNLVVAIEFTAHMSCGTSKTIVMVLYTIIAPVPSSNILDSTLDIAICQRQIPWFVLGQEWSNPAEIMGNPGLKMSERLGSLGS